MAIQSGFKFMQFSVMGIGLISGAISMFLVLQSFSMDSSGLPPSAVFSVSLVHYIFSMLLIYGVYKFSSFLLLPWLWHTFILFGAWTLFVLSGIFEFLHSNFEDMQDLVSIGIGVCVWFFAFVVPLYFGVKLFFQIRDDRRSQNNQQHDDHIHL